MGRFYFNCTVTFLSNGLKRRTSHIPSQSKIHSQPCLCSIDPADVLHRLASHPVDRGHLFPIKLFAWHPRTDLWDSFIKADPPAKRIRTSHGMDGNHYRWFCFCLCAVHVDRNHLDLHLFARYNSPTVLYTRPTNINTKPALVFLRRVLLF